MQKFGLLALTCGASALAISVAPRTLLVPQRAARVTLPTARSVGRAMPVLMSAEAARTAPVTMAEAAKAEDPIFETMKTASFFALW